MASEEISGQADADDPVVARIIEMYLGGQSIADIIEETGRSRTSIYYQLNRNGIPRDRQSTTTQLYGEEDVQELKDENARLAARVSELQERLIDTQAEMLSMSTDRNQPKGDTSHTRGT